MQRFRLVSALAGAATALAFAVPASAQMLDSTVVGAFRWRQVGPSNFMGRLSDVQGIPGPSKTLFVAAAGGGIWKSMNNGITWRPVFDDKEVVVDGHARHRAVATRTSSGPAPASRTRATPSSRAPASTSRPTAALHWTFMGLENTQHIGRIQIDPRNANVVYVAALGPAWKSGGERGLYKTTDGGATWKLIKAPANNEDRRDRHPDRSVESRRAVPGDVGALPHAVLAQLGRPGLGAVQVDRRRRDVDGDQGQRLPGRPQGPHRHRDLAQQPADRVRAHRSELDGRRRR